MPFFRRNNTIRSKIHSNCIFIIILYIRIVIIFFIWYFSLYSIFHSICNIIPTMIVFLILLFKIKTFWIFILIILPIFWNINSIVPKIITYSMIIIIFYIWIMIILYFRYLSFYGLFHSFCLSIIISFRIKIIFILFILYLLFFNFFFFIFLFNFLFIITNTFPLTRNLNTLLFHYIFYTHTIFIFNIRIMFKSIFWNLTIYNLNHSNCKSINILFIRFYNSTSYFLIIYSLLEPWFIYSFTFISYPMIWYWKLIIS